MPHTGHQSSVQSSRGHGGSSTESDSVISFAERAVASGQNQSRYTQGQLNQFFAAHERFVRSRPQGRRAVMRFLQAPGMDFSRRLLPQADFTGANLKGCDLRGADLSFAALYCADLSEADVRNANLRRADIRGVSLRNANLSGAILDEADLRQAVLARVDSFKGFHLAGRSAGVSSSDGGLAFSVDFGGCSMKGVKLANAKLKNANFKGALLQGADLKGAELYGASFQGAVLTDADLVGCRCAPDVFAGSVRDPSADAVARVAELLSRLESSSLWVATNGAEGAPATLDDEDLRPMASAFERRELAALSAKRVRAIGVSFRGGRLQGARFDGADLREADFSGANLRGASFLGADLRHARFDNADLQPLPLVGGAAREVDLTDADYFEPCFAKSQRG